MDLPLIILIISIVAIATAGEAFKHYLKSRKITSSEIMNNELELLRKQNKHLEQRVSVLEKIVTDSSYDLKSKINAL
ncbi:hypothetical protein L2719_10940 [Shewanella schlegeliana]|uniref:Nitrite reductase n=1 Tax=Shewanella schlegeliana TaxID=190308 RepID=A0ABS1T5A4_9GAMM|nr:hypothetical protein [Shewanella schlegeliana]MBL4915410.1 hypothetical protein [Shewanella schlegeliana]MCL1110066.1 hypothetical protein [Shewanella schlegeliana]GIU24985.1 hypothetical protein TUM4433_09210 [Shewanella schlegeliana]